MIHKYCFTLAFILILISSCTIYREYAIEVFQPEQIKLNPEIKNAVLLSRNFKYSGDTLSGYYKSDYYLRKDMKISGQEYDSILISGCFEGFVTEITDNKTLANVSVLPPFLVKKHFGEKMAPLSTEFITNLTESTNSDILISLETLSAFYSEFSKNEDTNATSEVITAAVWTIYNPESEKEIERKSMIDTIYWNGYNDQGQSQNLPPWKDAIAIAARIAGQNFAKRFSHSWVKAYRLYCIPPIEDFRLAAQHFEEGKWEEAMELWEKYTPSKIGRMAISARYNMALACEMTDDLDRAIDWLSQAMELAMIYKSKEDIKMILLYQNILQKRRDLLQTISKNPENDRRN